MCAYHYISSSGIVCIFSKRFKFVLNGVKKTDHHTGTSGIATRIKSHKERNILPHHIPQFSLLPLLAKEIQKVVNLLTPANETYFKGKTTMCGYNRTLWLWFVVH